MANQNSQPDGVLAFLSPEGLDKLDDLIIANLDGRNPRVLASQALVKQ
jgi:hypothetical protein